MYSPSFGLDRALLNLHDRVVVYDRLWRVRYVNEGAAAYFKRSRSELVGRCIWDVLPELVQTEYFTNLHKAVAEQCEMRLERRLDEMGTWIEEHIHPFAGGVAILAIDITSRKSSEQAQAERGRGLEQAIALAAHEIRGPLAPVKAGIQVLRSLYDGTPMMKRTIEMLERQTEHISRLVEDLLDASRLECSNVELQRANHCMSRLVETALEDARCLIERRGVAVNFAPCAEPLLVDVDAIRIAQVLTNVLTNACKYTDPGGRIDVKTYSSNGRAVVEVQDDGIGIPAENLASIFDLFSQVPEHRFRSYGGLGLGLALARSLLRLHDGTISAFSAGRGMGSRFTITLPLVPLASGATGSHHALASASCAESS
jgi:signal transduction histidine kinase